MSIGNWYRVGTVAVTNGSVNVVGTGTFWTSQCNPGDRFTVDGENWYEVNTITDDTHLALLSVGGSGAFAGTTGSNLAYAIDRNFTNNLNANIAASVASLVAQYQANSNGPLAGLFANGAAATPGIAFLNEASTGLFHPATGIAALAVQGAEFLRAVGTAAGVPAMLGLGLTAPANALDVFTTNNALYGARIQNSSAGTSARAALQIGNTSAAAQVLNLGVNGAGFTANGVLTPSRGFVEGPNGVDFASAVTSGTAFSWGVGAAYAQKMVMDYLGDVAIGGSPVTVAGYTTLTLNNATTGGIVDLQAAGVDVGRLTGSAAAMDLSAIGAAVPLTLSTNGSVRVKVSATGQVGIGMTPSNVLDITQTQNAVSAISLSNASTGTGAQAVLLLANSAGPGSIGRTGTGFTPTGVFRADSVYMSSGAGAGGLTLTTGTAQPIYFGINNTQVAEFDTSGRLGIGVVPSAWGGTSPSILQVGNLAVFASYNSAVLVGFNHYYNGTNDIYQGAGYANKYLQINGTHIWQNAPSGTAGGTVTFTTAMQIDTGGNLLLGSSAAAIARLVVQPSASSSTRSFAFNSGDTSNIMYSDTADQTMTASGSTSAHSAVYITKNSVTSRSLSSPGTLNASGADYAEYRQLIAPLHGAVAKGALLGYDASGLMTNVFANVVGRVLPKSTSPSYVGNDTWGTEEAIVAAYGVAAPEPQLAVVSAPGEDATEEEAAAYAAYVAGEATYQAKLAAFNAALEAERVKWDRIALCGVVPVNIFGLTVADIGKYLVPCAAADGTITANAVAKSDLTLGQYIDSFGTIEMIGVDARPLVNVKNG